MCGGKVVEIFAETEIRRRICLKSQRRSWIFHETILKLGNKSDQIIQQKNVKTDKTKEY